MISKEDITRIWSASYAKASLDPEADMRFVADAFESVRSQLDISDPYATWDNLLLDSDKFDNDTGFRLLADLRDNFHNQFYLNLTGHLQSLYEQDKKQASEQWQAVYADAAVHYRYDLLCMLMLLRKKWEATNFPVAGAEKLPAYIRENRWPDAVPIYESIAADTGKTDEIRALAEITLMEIVLYYYPETSTAIKHLEKAGVLLPNHFQTIRAEAIYLLRTGEMQKARNNLLKVIGMKPGDYFSFNIIGDCFLSEEKLDNARSWYMDAIHINFLQVDSFQRLLNLYANKTWFREKASLMENMRANILKRSETRNAALLFEKKIALPECFENLLVYDSYRDSGTAWLTAGDFSQAESWYRKAAELQPVYVGAWLDMATLYKEQGLKDKQVECLEKALQIDPEQYDAHWLMALYYSDAHEEKEAMDHFNKCLQMRPLWNDWTYNFIGNLYFSLGQYEKSQGYYERAVILNDALPVYRENLAGAMEALADQYVNDSRMEEAEKLYMKATSTDSTSKRWNIAGNFYYRLQEWQKAVDCYSKAIEINPADPVIHENKGLALEKLGKNELAEKSYMTALDLEKETGHYFNRLGVFYYNLGKYEQAVQFYQQAIDHEPEELIFLENICLAFESMKAPEKAEPYYIRMTAIAPDNDRILNLAGIYYFNRNNYEKAEEFYKKAIEKNERNDVYYQNLSAVYRATGRHTEGIQLLEKALEYNPQNDTNLNNIGVLYSDLNDHEKALLYFEKAMKINPGVALYYENIAFEKSLKNEFEEAVTYYHKALDIEPENDVVHNIIGLQYYNNGKYAEAASYFKKASELKPDNSIYGINLTRALDAAGQLANKQIQT